VVDRHAAFIMKLGIGHRRTVNLGFEQYALHAEKTFF
jgi:hypothetical protein